MISPLKSWSLPCYVESLVVVDVDMTLLSTFEEASYSPHVLQFLDIEAMEDSMNSHYS